MYGLYVCVYVTIHIYERTKTKLILDFLFILITLVGLYNIHVLNYTRNFFKKNCIPNTRKHFQGRYQTPENEIVFQKILYGK